MRLVAALVPPGDVLDHVAQMAASVHPDWEPPADPGNPGRHAASSGRLFGRRRDHEPAPARPTGPLLDLLPSVRMNIPIAKFGHLPLTETARLTAALEEQAPTWESPRLRLHGGKVLEPEGDDSVWASLDGDLDELRAVARGVSRAAQGLQLFVDRRVFRPELRIGTINGRTTERYLEQMLAALEAYEGPSWWQVSLALLIPTDLPADQSPYRVYRDIRLGPAVPH